jgi:hypothetical protein
VQPHFSDLVVATYGRGFWILDDVTPLRALTPAFVAQDAALFAPRPAYRFRNIEGSFENGDDPVAGTNPPYGAALDFWTRTAPPDSAKDSLSIQILDAQGRVVRTLKQVPSAGVNRVWWDLRYEPTPEAKLRDSPALAPWFRVRPEGTPAPGVGRFSVLASPGRYTVRFSARGKTYDQPLELRQDPNTGASAQDLAAQSALLADLVSDIDSTVAMINRVEVVRGQLAALKASFAGDSGGGLADVRAAADSFDRKLLAVEEDVFQVRVTGRGQDLLRWPMKLAEQLMYLAGSVQGSDFAPTGPQRDVQQVLRGQLRDVRARLDRVMGADLTAFRTFLRSRNLTNGIF